MSHRVVGVAAVVLLSLSVGLSCKEDAIVATTAPVDSIVLTPLEWMATRVGERRQFLAQPVDAQGRPVSGATVTFSSSDPTTVSIDAQGLATARAEGAATIRARAAQDSTGAAVEVASAMRAQDSVMYTVFVALADSSPVMLQDGKLLFNQATYGTRFVPNSPWQGGDVVGKFAWSADNYAVLTDMSDNRGTLWLKDRINEWALVAVGDVIDVKIDAGRFVWLHANGPLRAKLDPFGPVTDLDGSGVREFQLAGSRIGALKTDSVLRVKEGTISAPWVAVASSVVRFHMRGNLIAALHPGGRFRVKAAIDDPWTELIDSGVVDFKVSSTLVGIIKSDGTFQVKDGINGPWAVLASSGVAQFELEGDRILWRLSDGTVRVKDTPFGAVTDVGSGMKDIRLQGDFIGQISTMNELSIKRGINGPRVTVGTYPTLLQYRLIADVPQLPTRTNPTTYAAGRTACTSENTTFLARGYPDFCTTPYRDNVLDLVPVYGRFCGSGIPTDDNLDSARGHGPLDGMDQLCRHHDSATTWYPNDQGFVNACVVTYGLYYAHLTRNGSNLVRGSSTYNAAFATMPHLSSITAKYWDLTGSVFACPSEQFNQFVTATASRH